MKQIFIIGAGKFGYYVATELFNKGHEVIVIDRNSAAIQDIKENVSQAIIADATEIKVLKDIGINHADLVIIAIGTNLNASILATLNVKDLGVKHIIAKCLNESHGRILQKIGADEIIFPEKDMGVSIARRIHNPNLIDYLPFIEGYSIAEIATPKEFIGKTLKDLNLRNRYDTQVIAIKDILNDKLDMVPSPNYMIKDSDLLILLGPKENLDKLNSEKI